MQNILFITLLGGIGDVLIALPAIQALGRAHPQAKLTVLTFAPGDELIKSDPLIHAVICLDRKQTHAPHPARTAVQAVLNRHHFDLIVSDTTYDGIAALIQQSDTPQVVTNLWRSPPPDQKVGDRFLHILQAEGLITPNDIAPAQLHLMPAERLHVQQPGAIAQPLVLLYPDAGMAIKRWSTANFVHVGKALQHQYNATIVVPIGSDPEQSAQIAREIGGTAIVWAQGTLRELAALMATAALVIASDTGPARIAAALHTPTITLFGPSWHDRYGQPAPHVNLQGYPDCPERDISNFTTQRCWYAGKCPFDRWQTCLEAISPAEVLTAAASFLQTLASSRGQPTSALESLSSEVTRSSSDLTHASSELESLNSELTHATSEVTRSSLELTHASSELESLSLEPTHPSLELTRATSALESPSLELTHATSEPTHASSELTHASSELESLSLEPTHPSLELTRATSALESPSLELTHATSEPTHASSELTRASSELESLNSELTHASSDLTHATSALKPPSLELGTLPLEPPTPVRLSAHVEAHFPLPTPHSRLPTPDSPDRTLQQHWSHAKRILVMRLDNIGDVLMTSPALRAIKAALPSAHLTLMASPGGSQAAALLPWVNDVLVCRALWQDLGKLAFDPDREGAFIQTLRDRQFDAAIIFTSFSQTPHPAGFMCYLAGIPLRLGQSKEWGGAVLTTEVKAGLDTTHQVERNLHLIEAVGFTVDDRSLRIQLPAAAQHSAMAKLLEQGLKPHEPYILLNPWTSCQSRNYPTNRFAVAAQQLAKKTGYRVVVTGVASDRAHSAPLLKQLGSCAIDVIGHTNLAELAALIAGATLMLSNNTSTMHLADATRTPSVILFAGTEYESQWQPRHTAARLLRQPTVCSPCYAFICPFNLECLDLSPEQVVEAGLSLLKASLSVR